MVKGKQQLIEELTPKFEAVLDSLVIDRFNDPNSMDTGRGLAAGIGIVLLAIIIDRITLAWTRKQREALGL